MDRRREIEATFRRMQRPLRWPLVDFRRRKISTADLVGYRFSRAADDGEAGFFFGFALGRGELEEIAEPPEAVATVFVGPVGSSLHRDLVVRRGSAVRELVARSRTLGFPFRLSTERPSAAVRHRSLARVPPELFVLAASDFFLTAQNALRYRLPERLVKATSGKGR